jgi:hypothetical protein
MVADGVTKVEKTSLVACQEKSEPHCESDKDPDEEGLGDICVNDSVEVK